MLNFTYTLEIKIWKQLGRENLDSEEESHDDGDKEYTPFTVKSQTAVLDV